MTQTGTCSTSSPRAARRMRSFLSSAKAILSAIDEVLLISVYNHEQQTLRRGSCSSAGVKRRRRRVCFTPLRCVCMYVYTVCTHNAGGVDWKISWTFADKRITHMLSTICRFISRQTGNHRHSTPTPHRALVYGRRLSQLMCDHQLIFRLVHHLFASRSHDGRVQTRIERRKGRI